MKRLLPVRLGLVCLALITMAAVTSDTKAFANDIQQHSDEATRFRAGVRNAPDKRQLNAEQLHQVLQGLREKTGWQALAFDEAGFLICPDLQAFSGGSASARQLLGAALNGKAVYELETHNNSPVVSFGRLKDSADYVSHITGTRISSRAVQLDFADFHQLFGDQPALQAFDLGIVILHELAHGVWQLRDTSQQEMGPGECENFINRIRRELHLPERQTYEARARSTKFNLMYGTRFMVELRFVKALSTPGQTKLKRYRLQWQAESVGPIRFLKNTNAELTAALR